MSMTEQVRNVLIDNLDAYSKLLTEYKLQHEGLVKEHEQLGAKLKMNSHESNRVIDKANAVVDFLENHTGKTGEYQKAFQAHMESLRRRDSPVIENKE